MKSSSPVLFINFANEFSKFPSGVTSEDGPDSAERFREIFLLPALDFIKKFWLNTSVFQNPQGRVVINLDGTMGFASSFLQAAFGDLSKRYPREFLGSVLFIESKNDPSLVTEIWGYI